MPRAIRGIGLRVAVIGGTHAIGHIEQIEGRRMPIGIDIGALGAAEIALSILAEIVAIQRGKGGARR